MTYFSPVLWLQHLKNPCISQCEAQFIRKYQKDGRKKEEKDKKKISKTKIPSSVQPEAPVEAIPYETQRLEETVLQFEDISRKKEVKESWVHAAEQACNLILPGLPHTQKRMGKYMHIIILKY